MFALNQSINRVVLNGVVQNYATWILTVLLSKDFHEDIANVAEKWFETSNCCEDDKIPLPIDKKKKSIFLQMNYLVDIHTYSYLVDDKSEHEKAKGTIKWAIKRSLMFENYTDFLFNDKTILKSQQRFKSDYHNVYIKKFQ